MYEFYHTQKAKERTAIEYFTVAVYSYIIIIIAIVDVCVIAGRLRAGLKASKPT